MEHAYVQRQEHLQQCFSTVLLEWNLLECFYCSQNPMQWNK